MIFQNRFSAVELIALVKCIVIWKGEERRQISFVQGEESSLLFYVLGSETVSNIAGEVLLAGNSAILVGPSDNTYVRSFNAPYWILEVKLFPGAIYKLFGRMHHEIKDTSISLGLLTVRSVQGIEYTIRECKTDFEVLGLLERFLLTCLYLRQIETLSPNDQALEMLFNTVDTKNVRILADHACLSIRQFERLVRKSLGTSPKRIIRLNRFTTSILFKMANPELTSLDIAMEMGYDDYQHMARDYKEFSDLTPEEYWQGFGIQIV